MKDFCENCGFMLTTKENSNIICRSCEREKKNETSLNKSLPCKCEYCDRSRELILFSSNNDDNEENKVELHPKYTLNLLNTLNHTRLFQLCSFVNPPNPAVIDVIPQQTCLHQPVVSAVNFDKQVNVDNNNLICVEETNSDSKYITDIPLCENESVSKNAEELQEQWKREQEHYKQQLILVDTPDTADLVSGRRRKADGSRFHIGGVDISFSKENSSDACACLCVVRMPDLQIVYEKMEKVQMTEAYIPGYLAFREMPPLLKLINDLKMKAHHYFPDVILLDGNGILHPRGFGLASQLGVMAQVPTVGVAKTLISAQGVVDDKDHRHKKKQLREAGDGFNLISDKGEVLGMCLKIHDNTINPVYISVGHMISLKSAVWIALECSKYRIPEPIRRADIDSREYLRQGKTEPYEFIAT